MGPTRGGCRHRVGSSGRSRAREGSGALPELRSPLGALSGYSRPRSSPRGEDRPVQESRAYWDVGRSGRRDSIPRPSAWKANSSGSGREWPGAKPPPLRCFGRTAVPTFPQGSQPGVPMVCPWWTHDGPPFSDVPAMRLLFLSRNSGETPMLASRSPKYIVVGQGSTR
jgi:hypothetical protein